MWDVPHVFNRAGRAGPPGARRDNHWSHLSKIKVSAILVEKCSDLGVNLIASR